jgi:MFS family permease
MPLYVKSLGAPPDQIGWVMGAFAIGLLLSRTYLGKLSDRQGRCLVMRIGLVVATIIPLFYAITTSVAGLMCLRAIHGISIAAFATGYSALISDLAPREQRGQIIGYMSLVNPLGMGFGPALGDWIQQGHGYQVLFQTASGLALIGLIISSQIRESIPEKTLTPAIPFLTSLSSPRVRVPAFTLFMIGSAFGTLSSFLPLLIKETGADMSVGLFYLVTAIAGFTIRVAITRVSDRYGRGLFISIGLFFYALSMLIIFFAHRNYEFLAAAISEGIGAGLVLPSIIAMLADRTVPRERGFILGLVLMGFDLGIAFSGPLVGNIITHTNLAIGFLVATGLVLLALLVFSTQSNYNLANSLRFAIGRGVDRYALQDS